MLTVDEFQRKYHSYCVATKEEALAEIEQMEVVANAHLIVPVEFPGGWALMLDTAAAEIRRLGII